MVMHYDFFFWNNMHCEDSNMDQYVYETTLYYSLLRLILVQFYRF
jgi:hypothetical protein